MFVRWPDMLKVMYATDGVRSAGPQVGYMKRMVIDYPNGQRPFCAH